MSLNNTRPKKSVKTLSKTQYEALVQRSFGKVIKTADRLLERRKNEIGENIHTGKVGLFFEEDGCSISVTLGTRGGIRASVIEAEFDRGDGSTPSRFKLEYSKQDNCLVMLDTTSQYPTVLCRYDMTGSRAVTFGDGIGPKRQRRAFEVLGLILIRLEDLLV